MPFTPFHFGPHACIGLPLQRHIDLPMFIGANIVVDLEPLVVMLFDLRYPLHGYLHTLLFGGLAGALFALAAFPARRLIGRAMRRLRLDYRPSRATMVWSAVAGAWLHVLLDSFLYHDIMPFYPLSANPLLHLLTEAQVYVACALSFIPAAAVYLYLWVARRHR